jgi:hypothetical protein
MRVQLRNREIDTSLTCLSNRYSKDSISLVNELSLSPLIIFFGQIKPLYLERAHSTS